MSFVSRIIGTAERVPLPDIVIRAAIQRLCSRTATRLASTDAESDAAFADEMAARAIAEYTDEANTQHYEVPAAFFADVLGPNRKYSCCFYKQPQSTLREAEEEALRQTVAHADLADKQSILELGCGALVIPEQIAIPQADNAFDDMDNIIDTRTANLFRAQLARLVDMARLMT